MSTTEPINPINRAVAGIDAATRPTKAATAIGARAVKVRKKKRRITLLDVLAVIFMLGMLAFSLIPLAWMLSTSLKSQFAAIRQPPLWIPQEPTLAAYQVLLSPDSPIGGRFRYANGLLDEDGRLTIRSKIRDAKVFLDGHRIVHAVTSGDVLTMRRSPQTLTVLGLATKRRS